MRTRMGSAWVLASIVLLCLLALPIRTRANWPVHASDDSLQGKRDRGGRRGGGSGGGGVKSASKVVELTGKNFDMLRRGEWMISFSAPWCPHCQVLKPVWERLASSLEGSIGVGSVNVDSEKAVSQRMRITEYPSIYHVKNGVLTKFKGKMSLVELESFALGGFEKGGEVVPFLKSPFGPYGQTKGWLIRMGYFMLDAYAYLIGAGVPSFVIGFMLVIGGSSLTLALVLGLNVLSSKVKRD